jgi:hypothetical protein
MNYNPRPPRKRARSECRCATCRRTCMPSLKARGAPVKQHSETALKIFRKEGGREAQDAAPTGTFDPPHSTIHPKRAASIER